MAAVNGLQGALDGSKCNWRPIRICLYEYKRPESVLERKRLITNTDRFPDTSGSAVGIPSEVHPFIIIETALEHVNVSQTARQST